MTKTMESVWFLLMCKTLLQPAAFLPNRQQNFVDINSKNKEFQRDKPDFIFVTSLNEVLDCIV